ncbi:sugar kinase [Mailhella massiliensis]|uniref:Sugar kinase n=1 Tax=Mailhella massiliensis TaxID=1903261 RepID=A0A921DQP8_9BACT|nr:sugar kinase [Mailhella massiliensis]HJD96725.1 sugar kinase [Mailhella massiliensis]
MSQIRTWNVAVIGECMIELHKEGGHIVQTFGGDTLNTAAYLSRMCGNDVHVEYVSAVGASDTFSREMLEFWHSCGVHSALSQRIPGRLPGLYAIDVDASGERHFQYWRSEAAVRGCFETPDADGVLARLSGFDAVHLSGISLAVLYPESRERLLSAMERLAAQGVNISFDFNFRPHLWGAEPEKNSAPHYRRLSRVCRWVFLSPEELRAAGYSCEDSEDPAFYDALKELGAEEVIVKNGGKPCLILNNRTGETSLVPLGRMLEPRDTTAAGDSFTAAYLAAVHYGLSTREAVERAHRLASAVIMYPGAIIPAEVTPPVFADCQSVVTFTGNPLSSGREHIERTFP